MKKSIVLSAAMLLLFSTIALAIPGHGRDGDRGPDMDMQVPLIRWWKMPKVATDLQITPDESKKLDSIYAATKNALIEIKADMEKKMLTLEMQISSDDLNPKACLKVFEEVQAIRTSMAIERFQFMLETREVLGNDRFQSLMKVHEQKRGQACFQKSPNRGNVKGHPPVRGCPGQRPAVD